MERFLRVFITILAAGIRAFLLKDKTLTKAELHKKALHSVNMFQFGCEVRDPI